MVFAGILSVPAVYTVTAHNMPLVLDVEVSSKVCVCQSACMCGCVAPSQLS